MKSVAVVGAGVSGLVAAYSLKSQGLNVTLFESEHRAGGKIKTNLENGILWEEGANTMTEGDAGVGKLIDNLGLRGQQQFLRIILEPFLFGHKAWKSKVSDVPDQDSPESVGMFFNRHFGQEVVDYMIDPFVAGTSGGDPESLSMRFAFPDIFQLEKIYGSIIIGFINSKFPKKRNKKGEQSVSSGKTNHPNASFSFHDGLQVITELASLWGKPFLQDSGLLNWSYPILIPWRPITMETKFLTRETLWIDFYVSERGPHSGNQRLV